MALVGVGNQVVVQDKVGEYPAVPVGDKAADHKQGIVTQVELDFVERLQTFVDGNIGIPKFNLACARVKPFISRVLALNHSMSFSVKSMFCASPAVRVSDGLMPQA